MAHINQGRSRDRIGNDGELLEWAWQDDIVTHLRIHGWEVYAVPDSRRASAAGFPDLFAAHPKQGWALAAENKRWNGTLSAKQRVWLNVLTTCGIACYVWRADRLYKPRPVLTEIERIAMLGPGNTGQEEKTRWPVTSPTSPP